MWKLREKYCAPWGTVVNTNQRCGSAWSVHCRQSDTAPSELVYGHCSIGSKAEVFDAELHAIQKGLAFLASSGWPAGRVVICADNQAALLTLAANNQEGLEYARNALLTVSALRNEGWSVSGLWTPAHCGILGTRERTSWPKPARNLKHPVTMRGLRNLGFRPRRTLPAGPIHGLSKGTTQAQPSCRPRSL